jgi:dihydrofolate synthase/folylpolyglutamate synthase
MHASTSIDSFQGGPSRDRMQTITSFEEFEAFLARFTNYERVQFFRYDKKTLGIERMRRFAGDIGDPQLAYPSVHIGGTKGKGSTSLILEALLAAEGHSTGTYTSPHVEHIRERIRVAAEAVGPDEIVRALNDMLPALDRTNGTAPAEFPSFFELMTALAMGIFKRRRVDWGIFEVGLGGRLDATNILLPRWTAITSIGLEHTQQLGKTLGLIAREKAGIIKPGVPVVLGTLPDEAAREIERIAAEREAPLVRIDPESVALAGPGRLRIRGLPGQLPSGPVLGPALRLDLAIAFEIARRILAAAGRTPRPERASAALAGLSLPARVEVFPGDPPAVIDGAHTAESVEALRLTLDEIGFPGPRTLIFSIAAGKELALILPRLSAIADAIILTRADPVRSISPGVLREQLGEGDVIESPEEAFEEALRRGLPLVATGSFYLAGRLRPLLKTVAQRVEPRRH